MGSSISIGSLYRGFLENIALPTLVNTDCIGHVLALLYDNNMKLLMLCTVREELYSTDYRSQQRKSPNNAYVIDDCYTINFYYFTKTRTSAVV